MSDLINSKFVPIISPIRDWEVVSDINKVLYILKEYIKYKDLILSGYFLETKLSFVELKNQNELVFKLNRVPDFDGNRIIVYKTLSKQIEIEMEILKLENDIIHCKPMYARVAKKNRKQDRLNSLDGKVVASEFIVSKVNTDYTKATGFSGEILLNDIHKDIIKIFPNSSIKIFSGQILNDEEQIVKNYKKPIYVESIQTMASTNYMDCFDLKGFYEENFLMGEKKDYFKQKKIFSFVYYPILFKGEGDDMVVAYGYIDSPNEPVSPEILEYYKSVEEIFNERLRDANTQTLKIKQSLINISENGLLLEAIDEQLINALLAKPRFTANITFKLQAPLKFSYKVRFINKQESVHYVGAEIVGSDESKKNIEILKSYIKFTKSSQ